MDLATKGFANPDGIDVPACVLGEPLEAHMPDHAVFRSTVLAVTFESGPPENRDARSYVFYFYRGIVDERVQPDDILTFKVRYANPNHVHIVDKYLGGVASGAVNAVPLGNRHDWRPGMMSPAGQAEYKQAFQRPEKSTGCFVATAAFGSQSAPDVQALREFRDEVLVGTVIGRLAVRWYYRVSPRIAQYLRKHAYARYAVRATLHAVVQTGQQLAALMWR